MGRIFVVLFFLSQNVYADPILDMIYGRSQADCPAPEPQEEVEYEPYQEENGEHFSWELGTNDSLPELEVIIDPYEDLDTDTEY